MPIIGYRNNKKTRHMSKDGFKNFLVSNLNELNVLLMHNQTYAATVSYLLVICNLFLKERNAVYCSVVH